MTKQDLTHIVIVLDRSGSMSSVRAATEEAFDGFIAAQRALPGACRVSLAQFDDVYELVHSCVPIADVPKLKLTPRGGTALLDAIGRAIDDTGARLAAMPENERPGTVLFVIQTDGQENSSREFSWPRVAAMIATQRDTYGWQFTFLGAGPDAIATAGKMNIAPTAALHYNSTERGTRQAMHALNMSTEQLRTSRAAGRMDAVYGYSPEQKQRTAETK